MFFFSIMLCSILCEQLSFPKLQHSNHHVCSFPPPLKSRFWISVKRKERLLGKLLPLLTSSLNVACGHLGLLFRYKGFGIFLFLSIIGWKAQLAARVNMVTQFLGCMPPTKPWFDEVANWKINLKSRLESVCLSGHYQHPTKMLVIS